MKSTQIRAILVAPALAALALGAHIASGDTVTPPGPFTAQLCTGTRVSIRLGTATVNCNVSSTSGTVPAPTGAGTPVCGPVTAPVLSSCSVTSFGFTFSASCQAAGTWNLCVTPTTATLTGGTVNCQANVLGQTCRANSGTVTLNGTWTNPNPPSPPAPPPPPPPLSSATFTNQSVPVTTSGGFPCPSGTSATFSASYCTNPQLTVTDP